MKKGTTTTMLPISCNRNIFYFLLLVVSIGTSVIWITGYQPSSSYHPLVIWRNIISSKQVVQEDNENVSCSFTTNELRLIHEELQKISLNGKPDVIPIMQRLENVILSIEVVNKDVNNSGNQIESKSQPDLLDVCGEIFLGTKAGYMFFVTGWATENCTNVKPIQDVITIVLNSDFENIENVKNIESLLISIAKYYPTVEIRIPNSALSALSTNISASVVRVNCDKGWTPGRCWNLLLKDVKTPYVFVGKDLDYFLNWTARLERQIRVISTIPKVQIAGGAVRNKTGHWQVGCYQSNMYNFILQYRDGYYASKNECMYCDHLVGPFVAKTKLLKDLRLDEKLPRHVLFEDFFLRVKEKSHLIMNCPDVMHMATDPGVAKRTDRLSWQPLIKKWELNRLVLPTGKVWPYTCQESGLHCKEVSSRTNSFLLPPCCIEQFARSLGEFHKFCEENNVTYELEAGSALGVTKMNDYIPWDLDGDITFYVQNYSLFQSAISRFRKLNIKLSGFEYTTKDKSRGYFNLYTPDLYIEFWGEKKISKDLYAPEIFQSNPTRVRLHDIWVYGSISPGLLARNRYGVEIFKHAHSWLQLGMKTSWEQYRSGSFKKCKKPFHHSCLDHFSTDGNLQFQVPQDYFLNL